MLAAVIVLGKRLSLANCCPDVPHNVPFVVLGGALLWIGWFGFNAGSACAADVVSSNAFTTTTLATAIASFVWPTVEYFLKGKATVAEPGSPTDFGGTTVNERRSFPDSTSQSRKVAGPPSSVRSDLPSGRNAATVASPPMTENPALLRQTGSMDRSAATS